MCYSGRVSNILLNIRWVAKHAVVIALHNSTMHGAWLPPVLFSKQQGWKLLEDCIQDLVGQKTNLIAEVKST